MKIYHVVLIINALYEVLENLRSDKKYKTKNKKRLPTFTKIIFVTQKADNYKNHKLMCYNNNKCNRLTHGVLRTFTWVEKNLCRKIKERLLKK